MADFLRPDARATLWRYRDVIAALGVCVLGAWWLSTFYDPVRWLGWAFIALGVVWALGAMQKLRFAQDGQGPGVVKIGERRLAYFGPLSGGVMEMDDLATLELEPDALPKAHWILTSVRGDRLEIPVNADGSDDLFDLFASLPGIETEKMLHSLSTQPNYRVVIWRATKPLLH